MQAFAASDKFFATMILSLLTGYLENNPSGYQCSNHRLWW